MSALLSALLLAAAGASPVTTLAPVPESAEAALVMEGSAGRNLLMSFTPQLGAEQGALAPGPLGQELRNSVGVDLLSPKAVVEAGISTTGARALVFGKKAIGLSAPVEDEARAKKAVAAFLEQLGPTRQTRGSPTKGPLASGDGAQERAGWVFKTAAGLRLITASGKGAVTLAIQLAHVGRAAEHPLSYDPQLAAAQERLFGPVLLWVKGRGPLRGLLLRLAFTANSLDAQGLLLPASNGEGPALAQLLGGDSPPASACGKAMLCGRAAPGPLLRELLDQGRVEGVGKALRGKQREPFDLALRALLENAAGGALLRVDAFDPRAVAAGTARDLDAVQVLAASGAAKQTPLEGASAEGQLVLPGPPAACASVAKGLEWLAWPCKPPGEEVVMTGGPRELSLRLDTPALWASLRPLSALDALRGSAVGSLVALKLIWGGLLAASGPIEIAVRLPVAPELPSALAGSLSVDVQWPLPGKAPPQ